MSRQFYKRLPQKTKNKWGRFFLAAGLLLTIFVVTASLAFAQGDVLTDPPKNYELVTGWYQGRQTFYYEFGTNSAATEDGQQVIPAPIYVLVTGFDAEGAPQVVEGQNNIVDVIPGDEGYSDLWQVTFVTVPEDYEANTITSAEEVISGGYEQTVSEVFVNCPIVPAGSTLAEGGSELVQGWYKGQEVFYFEFEQQNEQTAPIYAFVTGFDDNDAPIFVDGQQNVIDVIPGDAGYSAFWNVNLVVVDETYEPNSITSADEVLAAGYDIMPAGLLVNCPVIRTDDAPAMTTAEEAPAEAPAEAEMEEVPAETEAEESPADLPSTGAESNLSLWLSLIAAGLVLFGLGFGLRARQGN